MKEFWKGVGLGLLSFVPAAAFAAFAGPLVALLMLVLAAFGAVMLAPVTAARIGGVAAGVLTPLVAGFGLLYVVLANATFG
ncbi:MAG TPA: hypothetical protein VNQ77_08960 [Frankiaceae bacterium]|nr:hypothetical protein [Frankiaceae bacterium]